jgi:hypothetical protein
MAFNDDWNIAQAVEIRRKLLTQWHLSTFKHLVRLRLVIAIGFPKRCLVSLSTNRSPSSSALT